MQIVINYTVEAQPIIGYDYKLGAKKLELEKLLATRIAKYEKDKETARYLYGKRKGAWGRMTMADEKRSAKLANQLESIKNLKRQINANTI